MTQSLPDGSDILVVRQSMFLLGAVRNLRRQPLSYVFGRFASVRRAYGVTRGVGQRLRVRPPAQIEPALIPTLNVEAAVASLHKHAVYAPLYLPGETVSAIHSFAADGACRRQARPPVFRVSDVKDGRLPTGDLAVLADVLDADRNDAVRAVANEPRVLEVISRYLGYVPTKRKPRLMWSFVCSAPDDVRLSEGQTTVYHFDVESYNFIYANYYLVDVDVRSGAHTMISGSHDDKPLSWLLGPASRTDEEIRARYPAERELLLEGRAGFGFIQDSSCYHRALAPIDRPRLMLQIRYS